MNHFIPKVFLYPTMRCNLHCSFCYSDTPGKQPIPRNELSLSEYSYLIGQLSLAGVKTFDISGGEPLLWRDFFALCGLIKQIPDSELWVTTNGTFIGERRAEVEAGIAEIDKIYVSLDSISPEIHNKMRGRSFAFAKTMEGIETLCQINPAKTAINSLLYSGNSAELLEVADFCLGHQISELAVLLPRDVGTQENGKVHSIPSWENYQRLLRELVFFIQNHQGIGTSFTLKVMLPAYLFPIIANLEQEYAFSKAFNPRLRLEVDPYRGCRAYTDFIAITVDGDVTGCPFMSNYPRYTLGNIRVESLTDILNRRVTYEDSLKKRKAILKQQQPCAQCEMFPLCQGGCPVVAGKYYGETPAPDPTCFRMGRNL